MEVVSKKAADGDDSHEKASAVSTMTDHAASSRSGSVSSESESAFVQAKRSASAARVQVSQDPLSLPKHKNIQSIMMPASAATATASNDISDAALTAVQSMLEGDMRDLICSLFWVLESKRLDRCLESSGGGGSKLSSSISSGNPLMAPCLPLTRVPCDQRRLQPRLSVA